MVDVELLSMRRVDAYVPPDLGEAPESTTDFVPHDEAQLLEAALAIDKIGDRLVRRVLTGYVAPAAFDAAVLVNPRLGGVVEVQILPFGDVRHRAAVD